MKEDRQEFQVLLLTLRRIGEVYLELFLAETCLGVDTSHTQTLQLSLHGKKYIHVLIIIIIIIILVKD